MIPAGRRGETERPTSARMWRETGAPVGRLPTFSEPLRRRPLRCAGSRATSSRGTRLHGLAMAGSRIPCRAMVGPGEKPSEAVVRARLTATYRFLRTPATSAAFYIAPEVAAAPFRMREGGYEVELAFPEWAGWGHGSEYVGMIGGDADDPLGIRPSSITGTVEFDLGRDIPSPLPSDHPVQCIVDSAEGAVRAAIGRLRAWVRVGQPWTGPLTVNPLRESLLVVDAATGARLSIDVRGSRESFTVVDSPVFTATDLTRMLESDGGWPDPGDDFLAEARLLSHWMPSADPQRGVMLAAMACELKAKAMLRRKASAQMEPMMRLIVGDSRAFPRSAYELYTLVPDRAFGRSLARDDALLAKALRKLFEARNGIAHYGTRPDQSQGRRAAVHAMKAFRWLESLLRDEVWTPCSPADFDV